MCRGLSFIHSRMAILTPSDDAGIPDLAILTLLIDIISIHPEIFRIQYQLQVVRPPGDQKRLAEQKCCMYTGSRSV